MSRFEDTCDHFLYRCAHGSIVSQCQCTIDEKPEITVDCPPVCAQLARDLPFINAEQQRSRGRKGRYDAYEGC